jgi:hypothetical protein
MIDTNNQNKKKTNTMNNSKLTISKNTDSRGFVKYLVKLNGNVIKSFYNRTDANEYVNSIK